MTLGVINKKQIEVDPVIDALTPTVVHILAVRDLRVMKFPQLLLVGASVVSSMALRLDDRCNQASFSSAFANYTNMFCPNAAETAPVEIAFDAPIPSYVHGLRYVSNSFAKFQIGDGEDCEQFSYYMDGYQKMNLIDFTDGAATFSSRFINSNYYELAIENGKPIAASTFNVTNPKRRSDHFPMQNFKACQEGNCDQAPVLTFLLPDNKTMVSSTDQSNWLVIDAEDLSTSGPVEWRDDIGSGSPAASHALTDPTTGDLIGVTLDSNQHPMTSAHVFRIRSDAPTVREVIGVVNLSSAPSAAYMHSFGLSKSYAVVIEQPVGISAEKLMTSEPMLDAFVFDYNETTKLHVMRLADAGGAAGAGSYVTFDAQRPFLAMHVGNTYEDVNDDGQEVLHLDVEMYSLDKDLDDPFSRLGFDNIFDPNFVPNDGNRYARITINMANGDVNFSDLLVPDSSDGLRPYGFVKINPAFSGVRNCYAYVAKLAGAQKRQSTIKYDHCRDEVAAEWNSGDSGLFPNEMIFIGDPEGEGEDDGVLFGIVYNAKTLRSEATFVDAGTMETLAVAETPFRVPWPLHGEAFPIPSKSPSHHQGKKTSSS